MVDHRGKLDGRKPKHIPIHFVSFGHSVPYGDNLFAENNQANTYTTAHGTNDLSEALRNGKTNVVLLNIAPVQCEQFLTEKHDDFAACNPLIVAPDHYREQIPKGLVAKHGIQFVPYGMEPGTSLLDMPEAVEKMLQQRAAGQSGPAGPK